MFFSIHNYTTINFRTFSTIQKETRWPLATSYFLSTNHALLHPCHQPSFCPIFAYSRHFIQMKFIQLALLTKNNVSKAHSGYSMNQYFIPLLTIDFVFRVI